jgi:hypothetical protein
MWSTHSRRIDPISRSAKPFCQGEAGAIGLSRMSMARDRRVTTAPYLIAVSRNAEPRSRGMLPLFDAQPIRRSVVL